MSILKYIVDANAENFNKLVLENFCNTKSATGIEFIITLESDENFGQQWRVTQERILPEGELEHDKNYGLVA